MGAEDRRRDARIQVAFEVLRAHPPLEGLATICDVSARGLRIAGTTARPEPGQNVQLAVRLPGSSRPLDLVGKVVRHRPDGFAVELEKPSPELGRLVGEAPLPAPAAAQTLARPVLEPRRAAVAPFQEFAADFCSGSQWLSGRICLPPRRTLLDHLNQDEPFHRVVDAVTPHQREPLAFVALPSERVDLIVPLEGQQGVDREQEVGSFVERPLRILLPYAVVDGSLKVLARIRVSDHLMRCARFVSLRDCRVRFAQGCRPPRDLTRVPLLLLNVRRVLGISDLAASPAPPDDPTGG